MKTFTEFLNEAKSEIEDVITKKFNKKVALWVKAGYEGLEWNAPLDVFLSEFHGYDVLKKALYIFQGGMKPWEDLKPTDCPVENMEKAWKDFLYNDLKIIDRKGNIIRKSR